jgi:hypothetical protein
MGVTCGRREREAGTGNEEERSFHVPAAATVEGTLVHGMPIAFAGCRRSVSLGRSDASVRGSFPCTRSHRRQKVSSGRMRRGTSSAVAKRPHSSRQTPKKRLHEMRTRPSLSPETRARLSPLNSQRESVGTVVRSVRYRGRANLRKQEEPAPGLQRLDGARLATSHRFRKGEGVRRTRKGRRSRPPSLRGSLSPGLVARTSISAVAEVGWRRLALNKLGIRAPKRAAGSSERGPSSS